MLLCGLWVVKIGASVIPRGVICAQTRLPSSSPSGIFGFCPFTYKSKAAPWSPVYFCCAPRSLFSGCAFYHLPFLFPSYPQHARACWSVLFCFYVSACKPVFLSATHLHVCALESLSDCDGLECCPGSLRVRRPPCLSSTAAQTMAPHGPAPRLIERLQPESEMVQSDRVAFYAGSIARASTLTSTISSIIHQAMPPG